MADSSGDRIPVQEGLPPATSRGEAAARIIAIDILLIFAGMAWLTWSSLPEGAWNRDWTMFYRAGDLWWQGRITEIYTGSPPTGYPFMYPPFAIYLFALFALVPIRWVQPALILMNIVAVGWAVGCLRSVWPAQPGKYLTVILVTLASGPFLSMLGVGHISGLYLLLITAGLQAMHHGRPFLAGVLWGALALKPNLCLPFVASCLVGRQWRVLQGMAACFAFLLASTVFMGTDVWRLLFDMLREATAQIKLRHDLTWKQQTLYAFWSSVLSPLLSPDRVDLVWMATAGILSLATLRAWWRGATPERLPRLVGITTLLVIAGNAYCWFYDTLLLVVPATLWFLHTPAAASRTRHTVIGVLLALVFAWQHLSLFWLKGGPALTGLFLSVWLLIEVYDLDAATAPTAREGGPGRGRRDGASSAALI